jgi:hypothetical protein
MSKHINRRETLRRGLTATSLLAMLPDWAIPALPDPRVNAALTL